MFQMTLAPSVALELNNADAIHANQLAEELNEQCGWLLKQLQGTPNYGTLRNANETVKQIAEELGLQLTGTPAITICPVLAVERPTRQRYEDWHEQLNESQFQENRTYRK